MKKETKNNKKHLEGKAQKKSTNTNTRTHGANEPNKIKKTAGKQQADQKLSKHKKTKKINCTRKENKKNK